MVCSWKVLATSPGQFQQSSYYTSETLGQGRCYAVDTITDTRLLPLDSLGLHMFIAQPFGHVTMQVRESYYADMSINAKGLIGDAYSISASTRGIRTAFLGVVVVKTHIVASLVRTIRKPAAATNPNRSYRNV